MKSSNCCYNKNDPEICSVLSCLFKGLNIPLKEQILLVSEARKKSKDGCRDLVNILLFLHQKTETFFSG